MTGEPRPTVVYSGRCDEMQHGALEAALMVRAAAGDRPVRLIVNGAPAETVGAARRLLSNAAGRYVEVRALTGEKQAQRQAISTADVVIVPSGDEHVGLTALDAIAAGVLILVADTSGLGAFLLRSGRVDPRVAEHAVIGREPGERYAPLERWTARLADVLADPETAKVRAARLREGLRQALVTLQSAGASAADLVKAIVAARGEGNGDD
ncbi:glycosyltransferase [Actinospica robiniae]|uniref:glycosyltransferase n=1 Tax=Actinospica robiniae TaxID=304901 RepID=UPI00316AD25A